MNNVAVPEKSKVLESVLLGGDLKNLAPEDKIKYFYSVCDSVGLNPLTQPFEFITLNGRLKMYATRTATDQLRTIRNVSVTITSREKIDEVYIVTARAKLPDGREDESTGAVMVGGLKGDALANAFMKAETKAKRRVTLSICGLGLLDESEVETISTAQKDVSPARQAKPSDDQKKPDLKEAKKPVAEVVAEPAKPVGDFVINFTKGYKGKKIKDVNMNELEKLLTWCIENDQFREFQVAAEAYITSQIKPLKEVVPSIDENEPMPSFEDYK